MIEDKSGTGDQPPEEFPKDPKWRTFDGTCMDRMENDPLFVTILDQVRDASEMWVRASSAFGNFLRDLVCAFYQGELPEVVPASTPWSSTIEKVVTTAMFKRARYYSSQNLLNSIFWAIACAESFVHIVDRNNLDIEAQKDIAGGDLDEIDKELQEMMDESDIRQGIEQLFDEVTSHIRAMNTIMDGLDAEDSGGDPGDPTGGPEGSDTSSGYSIGNIHGNLRLGPLEAKVRLADLYERNKKFGKIVDLVGRLSILTDGSMKSPKKVEDSASFDGYEYGNDLERIDHSDLAKDDDIFDADFANESLSLQKLQKPGYEGRGPIIVLHDKSSSMDCGVYNNGVLTGNRDQWCSAIFLGVLRIARRQKRDVVHIPFTSGTYINGNIGESIHRDKISVFKKGIGTIDMAMNAVMIEPDGGTDYVSAILNSLDYMIKSDLSQDADILILGDGESYFTAATKKKVKIIREEHGVRIFGIIIGEDAEGMKEVCDELHDGVDLADAENSDCLKSIYRNIEEGSK